MSWRRRNPRRFRLILLGALIVAGIGISIPLALKPRPFQPDPAFSLGPISSTESHQIPKLNRAASALAGRPTIVNCWSQKDWAAFQVWHSGRHEYRVVDALGVTYDAVPGGQVPTPRIQLSPVVCQMLAAALARPADQPLLTTGAVNVLAHESAHASGVDVEFAAECRAMQTDARAARLLGVPEPVAAQVPHIYRGTIYPYDTSLYKFPPVYCHAGLPGISIPDTLGSAADLRPLAHTAAAVGASLSGWKNLGGGAALMAPYPCSPVASVASEQLRYGELLAGPRGSKVESLVSLSIRFHTRKQLASAEARYPSLERCAIAADNRLSSLDNSGGTESPGRIPSAFARLSPQVNAYRILYGNGHVRRIHDVIYIFDPANLGMTLLEFHVPAGTPVAQELRATKAALQAMR